MIKTMVLVLLIPTSAQAYTLAFPGQHGCHEEITSSALRTVRANFNTAPPIVPTRNERALIDDLEWEADNDMRDLGAISLLLGVRDNDLKGYGADDTLEIVQLNGDPNLQHEHCLRAPDEDEPDGSMRAIADCQAFVHERVGEALQGLDENGVPDPNLRVHLPIDLALRGSRTDSLLPQFYVRMGMALHAVEDGFAHNFRTPDAMQITSVLNWSDYVEQHAVETRDGPPHETNIDDCHGSDPLRAERLQLATAATTEILQAALDPSLDVNAKQAQIDTTFAHYFTIMPGCDIHNQYCDPAENKLRDWFGCSFSPARSSGGVGALLAFFGLMAWRRSRRRAWLLALFISIASTVAHADEAPSPPSIPAHPVTPADEEKVQNGQEPGRDIKTPTVDEIKTLRHDKRLGSRVGFYAAFGGSIDRPAIDGVLALRVRLTERWVVGVDTEMNPWITTPGQVRLGAFNIYATLIRRYPLAWSRVNLRTTLHLGTSVQLLDLYGAERGSVGLFGGVAPLGIDVDLGHHWRFVLDPLGVYLPVPHLPGVPLFYLQFRCTLGFQFAA